MAVMLMAHYTNLTYFFSQHVTCGMKLKASVHPTDFEFSLGGGGDLCLSGKLLQNAGVACWSHGAQWYKEQCCINGYSHKCTAFQFRSTQVVIFPEIKTTAHLLSGACLCMCLPITMCLLNCSCNVNKLLISNLSPHGGCCHWWHAFRWNVLSFRDSYLIL